MKKKTAGKDAKAGKLVAVRTGGPGGKIWTAGARAIKDLGFRTAQMHEKIITSFIALTSASRTGLGWQRSYNQHTLVQFYCPLLNVFGF